VHRTGIWRCDFVATDPAADVLGGFVQLVLPPDSGDAWYWAYVVGPRLGTVAVRDHEVPRPRRAHDLTVRADGLWAELVCEISGVQWTIGLEAFGVRLDHPRDALRGELGERIALGLDLEWDEGAVFGDVLIGTDTIAFEGAGVLAEGDAEPTWATTAGMEVSFDADGVPVRVTRRSGDARVDVETLGVVMIPDAVGGRPLARVLARWEEPGVGTETSWIDVAPAETDRA